MPHGLYWKSACLFPGVGTVTTQQDSYSCCVCCHYCFKTRTGKSDCDSILWLQRDKSLLKKLLKKPLILQPKLASAQSEPRRVSAFGKSRYSGPGCLQDQGHPFQVTPLCRPHPDWKSLCYTTATVSCVERKMLGLCPFGTPSSLSFSRPQRMDRKDRIWTEPS